MYAYANRISQQEKVISGAVAAGMHLMFLALLVFGVNWQRHVEPPVNIVDLWPSTSPAPPAPPAPPVEPAPPPPPPEVKPEPKVVEPTPPKPAPRPEPAKPDIAVKDKVEKEKRAAEEKQKDAKKKEEEAQKAQAAEAQRAANEQAEAQRRAQEQAAAAQAKLIAEYTERIKSKIQRLIVLPPNMQGNPEAEFNVVLLPDGNPLGVKLKRSSGNPAYDNAVERAILKAQPLPLPPDQALFRYFRELNLAFRPQQ